MADFREKWLRGDGLINALTILLLFTTTGSTVALWKWQRDRSRAQDAAIASPFLANEPASGPASVAAADSTTGGHAFRGVDLSAHFNAALTNAWHFRSGRGSATLQALPQGLQEFGGVPFDVRGIVQLASVRTTNLPQYPERSTGIPVGGLCRALHFLQATGWMAHEGTTIASYWIHYADGTATEFPIVYGEHLREWHGRSDRNMEIASGQLAWQDNNPRTRHRLFQCRWENPKPDAKVLSVDFVSAMTDCFPFLIAITVE